MRSSYILPVLGFLLFFTSGVLAQATDTTVHLKVMGECDMCKSRIEAAAEGRGVVAAKWNVETKDLTVTFNPSKTSLKKIENRIIDAGHDTQNKKAADKDYNQLPECCLYRSEVSPHADDKIVHTDDAPLTDDTIITTHAVQGIITKQGSTGLEALPGASITWLNSSGGTIADATGHFELKRLNEEKTLVVSFTGFRNDTIKLTNNKALEITLRPTNVLGSVTVKSTSASMFVSTASAIRSYEISSKELTKAACCNLSESFETNPSVDVTFSDAISGSKQIQMLGLAGNYTQLTVENLPGPRGLATPLGLNSIPGTWVENMQLVKGTGSVINGFESIAGQINVELKKPDEIDPLYINIYRNDFGKTDLNLNLAKKINDKWSTALLLHDAFGYQKVDMNKDGFKDQPTGNLFSAFNRWSYTNGEGFFAQFGAKYLKDLKTGGSTAFDPSLHKYTMDEYGLNIEIDRKEVFAKVGYIYEGKPYKSIGLQMSAFDHNQNSYFGLTTYNGNQKTFYSNLIYQSIIGNTNHKFKTGASFIYDKYDELYNTTHYKRTEIVPGAFFEYVFKPTEKFDMIAGIRGDYNNLFGFFASPRLNVRYEPIKGTTVRVSAGRGQRTANIFAENNSVMVSARQVNILNANNSDAYGLNPEVSWNKGITIDQKFKLFNRSSVVSVDFFRNDFINQIVVDLENARQVNFYNLVGKSYSNSFQVEWNLEPVKNLKTRLAYRYFDVKTTYGTKLLARPLNAPHRLFGNLGYEISTWKFDYTINYNGKKRLPSTAANPSIYQLSNYSDTYVTMNAQVSKSFGKKLPFDVYVGAENLSNFIQDNAIIAADKPFSQYFDASQVWGPLSGRMLYAGVRFTLK